MNYADIYHTILSRTEHSTDDPEKGTFDAVNARLLEAAFAQLPYMKGGLKKSPPKATTLTRLALRGPGELLYDIGYLLPHGPCVNVWAAIGMVEVLPSSVTNYAGKGYQLVDPSGGEVKPNCAVYPHGSR